MGVTKIVGLGGTFAESSSSLHALRIALDGARDAGAAVESYEVRSLDLPMYAAGIDVPEGARRLADAFHSSHGLIWSSPLYHGTISGAFKNAIDWLELLAQRDPAYLTDKVIGLICAAGGMQALQAVNTMEFMVRALRGLAVPLVVTIDRSSQAFDERGRAKEEKLDGQLRTLGREVVRIASKMST
jgi:FMN reductase